MTLHPLELHGMPHGHTRIADGFRLPGTSLRERGDIGCLMITSAAPASEVAAQAGRALGITLPFSAGPYTEVGDARAHWLTPRSWLILCPPEHEGTLGRRVNAAFPDKLVHASLFGDCLIWLELDGEGAELLLREGGFVSLERDGLPPGHAKRTLLAGVAVVLLHETRRRWLVGVERSRASWFLLWMKAAAHGAATLGAGNGVDAPGMQTTAPRAHAAAQPVT